MIVYMKNECLGHFTVNVFVPTSDTVNIVMLGYSSDPMYDAYYIVENDKEFWNYIIINNIYNLRLCCHIRKNRWRRKILPPPHP